MFIRLLVVTSLFFFACSESGGGNLGYSGLTSSPGQSDANAMNPGTSGQSFQTPGQESFTNTNTDTGSTLPNDFVTTTTLPPEDPKPVGSKVITGTALKDFFKTNSEIEIILLEGSDAISAVSDDEDTAKNLCASLRYDKFTIITGGQSFSSVADNTIVKWDNSESKFRIMTAEDAGNSFMFKLECSND